MMKLCISLMLCFTLGLSASTLAQQERVNLDLKKVSIKVLFDEIQKQTSLSFVFNTEQAEKLGAVSVQAVNETVESVLRKVLVNSGMMFEFDGSLIIVRPEEPEKKTPEKLNVKGTVKDDKGETLPGVTIRVKGTTLGFVTNVKGEFDIDLPKRDSMVLIFSFVGYKRQEIKVQNDMKPLAIVMQEDLHTVGEVVVTGIFNKPKESFTGAVTAVSKEELQANYSRNMLQTLSNLDPSFRILQNNEAGSNPNVLPEIQLRGASSMVNITKVQSSARAELNLPLFILDGFEVSLQRVMDLNDDDVENITILKDAGATALYGSRGANGVIVITSTKPEPGKLKVRYRGTVRLELVDLSSYDRLNAKEKLDLENRLGVWDYYKETDVYKDLEKSVAAGENFDWLDVPTRNGVGQNHVLSVMGGDGTWQYSANLSYDSKVGVMKGSERNNFNGSLHLTYNTDKLMVMEVLSVGTNNNKDSEYGSFSEYVNMNKYWNPFNEDGSAVYNFYHPLKADGIRNPMYNKEVGCWNESKYTNVRNTIQARYNILESFYVTGSLGLTRQIENKDNYMPPTHEMFLGLELDQKGSFARQEKTSNQWQARLGVNYTNTFSDKHMLTLDLSGEMEEKKEDVVRWGVTGFINSDIDHPSMALGYSDTGVPDGNEITTRRLGVLFSGNYYYDMRYFVDMSYRVDGSSSFGKESRYAHFFSVGGGWTVSNERFMQDNVGFINNLKLRGSYGVSGNMGFTPEEAMTVYHISTTETYLSGLAAYLNAFGNPALKWQNTYQYNIGVDLGLWNNLLQFQFNYYNKETDNTVSEMLLPITHGFDLCKANIGVIRNEGYELNITANILRDEERDLRWNISGRFSRNKNTVVKLSDAYKDAQLQYDNDNMATAEIFYKYQEGRSLDAIYALRTIGIDPLTGKRLYLTKDGKVTLRQNKKDMVYVGDRQPKVNGNISTSFLYKGFSVNVGFSVRLGGKQFNSTLLSKTENANVLYNLDRRVLRDCWENPGDQALFKKVSASTNDDATNVCDMFVQKDNTLQCTNINVSYQFPKAFIKRHLGMQSLTFGVNLSDIFYVSTIKRERGTDYPFSRNPNFNISCTF